jgi:hypothetical protein
MIISAFVHFALFWGKIMTKFLIGLLTYSTPIKYKLLEDNQNNYYIQYMSLRTINTVHVSNNDTKNH